MAWADLLQPPSAATGAALVGFLSLLALLEAVLPGQRVSGVELADGTRIIYKCNGLLSLVVLLALLGAAVPPTVRMLSNAVLADRGPELFSTTLTLCVLLSIVLCLTGYASKSPSSSLKCQSSGNALHDWWFGLQLNPQFLTIDIKFFWIKAGMISWLLINFSIASKQIEQAGFLTLPMALYQVFCTIYVLDFLWYEEYMTSTWDIIAEKFGFMLIFGDMVWIPFTFSIQGWWLLHNNAEITRMAAFLNALVFLAGYAIFRGANKQKHEFKKNPKAPIWGKPPVLIGGKLLVSGYWGIARHCNYLGDLLLALSFSLPCGTSSIVPYFYPIYLFILLVWRERRDEARCRAKYKAVWEEYCKAVPWRIFPRIY
ncbi:delta(14)-sterol reductase isoform X1 [Selaginella moellendorffii]|uniref:delta(14)-sterol reductase isoform X1 n=1 Tax=Selaginella moellendorffii TaxID=88036 RepID=UPI000D1C6498|nr:delta(14)-sterol reductase isoform X1 [Selaginella moellendorffii]|eukprot:XP_024533852.1 delta(14)-sterol reductase isoform X1 [Selaginella moellendorffii]